jgi:WD40 repeat protein
MPIGHTRVAMFHPTATRLVTRGDIGLMQWTIQITPRDRVLRFSAGEREVLGPGDKLFRTDIVGLDGAGKTLAQATEGWVQLLDLTTKGEKDLFAGADDSFEFATLSRDGRLCAASSLRGKVTYVFDVATQELRATLPGQQVTSLAFSSDNRLLGVGGVEQYDFWDAQSWEKVCCIDRADTANLHGFVAFSPDSRIAAVAYSAQMVRLVDSRTGHELATLDPPEPKNIGWLAFSPDGTKLVVTGWDGSFHLWDLQLLHRELTAMKLEWEWPR